MTGHAEAAGKPLPVAKAPGGQHTTEVRLHTFAEKHAAERAVRRVAGVRGIALELDVKLALAHKRSDSEIAQAATSALRWNSSVPDGSMKVEVEEGRVTLTAEVTWGYQLRPAGPVVKPYKKRPLAHVPYS